MSQNMLLSVIAGLALLTLTHCSDNDTSQPPVGNYNERYSLECNAINREVPIEWWKDSKNITDGDTKYEINKDNHTLTVLKVDQTTVGDYICTGNNQSQAITLYARPFVAQFDKEKNVIESDPLTIVCNAWAYPEPVLTWFKGTTELFTGDLDSRVSFKNGTAGNLASFPILENGTLRVTDVKFDVDNGTYVCHATNDYGTGNATIKVNVKSKYAALWPFLGICAEVAILCTIILIYEKRRTKRLEAEESAEEAAHLNANNDKSANAADDVRQRK